MWWPPNYYEYIGVSWGFNPNDIVAVGRDNHHWRKELTVDQTGDPSQLNGEI